jgi:hypothetical protein
MSPAKYTRLGITLPSDLVRWADREAKRLGRSRSWVIAEALRRASGTGEGAQPAPVPGRLVRERTQAPYAGEATRLGAYRQEQLEADLALTPEQRVREAEETLRLSELIRRRGIVEPLILFERYEDYLEWRDRERVEAR